MASFSRTPKRRRDTPPPIPTAIGGLLVIIGVAALMWQALRVYNGVPTRSYSTVYVSTPQVGNLLSHDQVRIAGARVGQVLKRDVGPDAQPRIELQIEPGTDLPADTKVAVRGAGLLGARYVELIPGRSKENVRDGATLKGTASSFTFGVPETLDTFDAETRGRLGSMVGGLGLGLLGHGTAANDALHAVGKYSRPFGEVAAEILRRDGAARRLVPSLQSAVAPLDANRVELARLARTTADAVAPFADRRTQLRATLDEAPSSLAALRRGLGAGTGLVASVGAVAAAANGTLPNAPAGLRSLTGLLRESRVPLRRASALLEAARPAAPGALRITRALSPLLEPVREMLGDLSPILGHTARYSCDIVNFGLTMRSMTGYTQPGEGPHGPAQAFRLQMVAPLSTDIVGVKDRSGFNKRDSVVKPCTYLAKPYPQFVGGSR
jgi:ABC-type transporter Mla subunit MlaD